MKTDQVINFLKRRLQFISFLALLGVAAGLLARFYYLFELCTHFRLQAIIALVVCGLYLVLLTRPKWYGFFTLIIGLALSINVIGYFVTKRVAATGEEKRILFMNVLTSNPAKDQVADYILKMNPEVVVLAEVNESWEQAMVRRLSATHPHQIIESREDNFGIAAFSKRPFKSAEIREIGEDVPSVDLFFDEFRLIGTHPVPPMNPAYFRSRNQQLTALTREIAGAKEPLILCGDLNCTPWSPFLKDFMSGAGLQDSARGFGIFPTWTGATIFFGLPLDHIFHNSAIVVTHREIGPDLGSDHRAVMVDFRMAQAAR
jgi:endonuclease/exonuclease/phosphatase (EEP) superfamily protein YafD